MAGVFKALADRCMEDPAERDRKFKEHVTGMQADADKLKEHWAQPDRARGFWKSPAIMDQYKRDLKHGAADRINPYTELVRKDEQSS